MTRSPLLRACMALRLPRGLYCYNARADVPLSDAEIRANLRLQPPAVEGLVKAVACALLRLGLLPADADNPDAVAAAARDACDRNSLPPSMVGAVIALAMTARAEDGAIAPEEWALVVEVAL